MWDGLWRRDKEAMLKQLKKECDMMSKNKELAKNYPGKFKIKIKPDQYENVVRELDLFQIDRP